MYNSGTGLKNKPESYRVEETRFRVVDYDYRPELSSNLNYRQLRKVPMIATLIKEPYNITHCINFSTKRYRNESSFVHYLVRLI